MNLGIIAHNSKKVLIEDFCIAYKNILAKHEVYATGTTGRLDLVMMFFVSTSRMRIPFITSSMISVPLTLY